MAETEQTRFKRQYPKILRAGLVGALLLVLVGFAAFPARPEREPVRPETRPRVVLLDLDRYEVPRTENIVRPTLPSVAFEVLSESVTEQEFFFAGDLPFVPTDVPMTDEALWEFDEAPEPVHLVRPVYPANARSAWMEGLVRLRVWVDENGRVEDCVVLESPLRAFDEPTVDAVRLWRFRPARKDGRAVRASLIIPVLFELVD